MIITPYFETYRDINTNSIRTRLSYTGHFHDYFAYGSNYTEVFNTLLANAL